MISVRVNVGIGIRLIESSEVLLMIWSRVGFGWIRCVVS